MDNQAIIAALSKEKKKLRTIWTPEPEQEERFFDALMEEEEKNTGFDIEEEIWQHSTQQNKSN